MSVIREFLRVLTQSATFSVQTRRPGIIVLIAIGTVAVTVAIGLSMAAPVVIYPLL
jgi:hypothetical protein